jgi:hypothetical protein
MLLYRTQGYTNSMLPKRNQTEPTMVGAKRKKRTRTEPIIMEAKRKKRTRTNPKRNRTKLISVRAKPQLNPTNLVSHTADKRQSVFMYVTLRNMFSFDDLVTMKLVSKHAKYDVESCHPRIDLSDRTIHAGLFLRNANLICQHWRLTGLHLVGHRAFTYTQPEIKTLDFLSRFPWLHTLRISDWRHLTCIQMLIHLPQLRKLIVANCPTLSDVTAINRCYHLRVLTVSTCANIHTLELVGCTQLLTANVYTCPMIDISAVFSKTLTCMRIYDCGDVKKYIVRSKCPRLRRLQIRLNGVDIE